MHRIGRFVFQGAMWPLLVVDAHGLFDHFGSLFEVGWTLQQEFALENAVDPFGQGILIAVVAVGHRAAQAVAPMNVLIVGRAKLNPAIGVMDQCLARLARAQCVLQRLTDLFGLQAVVNVMADDAVRERIGDQAQIDIATRPFPLANGAVFVTGNPDTGQRAAIENSTGVTEVCFTGVKMRCNYAHGSLSAGQQLRGLGLFAVAGVSVSGCVVLNLPNSGIVAMDCSDATITDNHSNGNGYGPPQSVAGTKNGISASGLILHTPRLANAYAMVISNNECNYNCDEGI
jgi:hypothetical protein